MRGKFQEGKGEMRRRGEALSTLGSGERARGEVKKEEKRVKRKGEIGLKDA